MTDKNTFNWKTLPMELMSDFDNCLEWTLMERLWFKSNHNDLISLSYLAKTTPIKTPATLLRVLNRMVKKDWVTKTPIPDTKQNKYALNKVGFILWATEQLAKREASKDTEGSYQTIGAPLSNDRSGSYQMIPVLLSNDSGSTIKRYHIDNLDNSIDNKNSKPVDNGKLGDKVEVEIASLKRLAAKSNWPTEYLNSQINAVIQNCAR